MNADQLAQERARFEHWYATHAFNYSRDPIGSCDCSLQWEAWQAALAEHDAQPAQAAQPLAEALQVIERYALDGHVMHGDAIRRIAEQRERAETSERRLERSLQDNAEWRARTLTAEAELAALKKRIAEINERLSDVEGNEAAWMRRAKYAENRIEKAPKVKVRGKIGEVCTIHVSHDLAGERVALLKMEDGE